MPRERAFNILILLLSYLFSAAVLDRKQSDCSLAENQDIRQLTDAMFDCCKISAVPADYPWERNVETTLIEFQGGLAHQMMVILHVLLFVYWLGGDLGVFYSSKFVVKSDISPEARATAAKIMLGLDLIPRVCMSLMLTVGGILTEFIGLPHPLYQKVGIVLLGPVWLFCVIYLHFRHGSKAHPAVAKFDMFIRWAVVIGLPISLWWHWESNNMADYPWVAGKLLVFAFLVFCGIMVRRTIGPFFAVQMKCRTGKMPTDEENAAQRKSLSQVRVWVFMIWAGVFLSGFVGIMNRSGIIYGG
jgi:hypothetical protein